MKRSFVKLLKAVAIFAVLPGVMQAAEATSGKEAVVPLIVIDNVPLPDALRNLARQAGGNFIFDLRFPGFSTSPGQSLVPFVTARWTNLTARAALAILIKEHKLAMVTSPATTVTRIAPAKLVVQPVTASQVGTNGGPVIPLLVMDDEPLVSAITKLADQARLKVSLDLRLADYAKGPQATVSIRFEKVTARQALAAVLDSFELILVEEPTFGSARILLKSPPEITAPKNEK